jgi:hypothetical protein
MNYSFAAFVVGFLLGVLWFPSLLVALRLKRLSAPNPFQHLFITWVLQVFVAASGIFLADYVGLHNPAGYVLAITSVTGFLGACFLWRRQRPHRATS